MTKIYNVLGKLLKIFFIGDFEFTFQIITENNNKTKNYERLILGCIWIRGIFRTEKQLLT